MDIEEAVKIIQGNNDFVLTTHLNPDGDALGSLMGLGLALLKSGKKVSMVLPYPVLASYQFLPGCQHVLQPSDVLGRFDVGIILDCTEMARAGEKAQDVIENTRCLVNVDHHISNQYFGDLNVVDPQAAATGEIVCSLLVRAGITITPDIATNLYVALVTDTGSFQHQNTTAKCLRTAAYLLDCGAKHNLIHQCLYEQKSLDSLRLLSRCLESLALNKSGAIAWMTISQDVLLDSGAVFDDSDGMIDYTKSLKGVEVGILFKEVSPGEIKVSFRSKNYLDVNQLAACFGGGGHERAAGCTVQGRIKNVEALVIEKTEELLAASCGGPKR